MPSDEIRLELNEMMLAQAGLDEHIRHNAIKETHWEWLWWFWVGTVILLSLGVILNNRYFSILESFQK